MSIGDRIKFFRKKKGWTQKDLGLKIGYSERSAGVRIAQYEANKKTPREKTLSSIVDALGVSVDALIASNTMEQAFSLLSQLKEGDLQMFLSLFGRLYQHELEEKRAEALSLNTEKNRIKELRL